MSNTNKTGQDYLEHYRAGKVSHAGQKIAESLRQCTPSFMRIDTEAAEKMSMVTAGAIFITCMSGPVSENQTAIGHSSSMTGIWWVACGVLWLFVAWSWMTNIILAQREAINTKQAEEINAVLAEPGREAWAQIVGSWYEHRPLTNNDYRRVMKAAKIDAQFVAQHKSTEEMDSCVLGGPIGAALARAQLERGTDDAGALPSAGARL
jgi:hypothetical protein